MCRWRRRRQARVARLTNFSPFILHLIYFFDPPVRSGCSASLEGLPYFSGMHCTVGPSPRDHPRPRARSFRFLPVRVTGAPGLTESEAASDYGTFTLSSESRYYLNDHTIDG
jgi:hypothetical protein